MQIWIHDKSMRKVCALNNNIPGMLPYSNSQWHNYLEYSTSTLDFTIPKIVNGKLHEDIKYINDALEENGNIIRLTKQNKDVEVSYTSNILNTEIIITRNCSRELKNMKDLAKLLTVLEKDAQDVEKKLIDGLSTVQ